MASAAPSPRLYDGIVSTFENGLRSSALKLAEFGVALKQIGQDHFSVEEFAHVCAIIAKIYYDEKEYGMAEPYIDRAISSASGPSSTGVKKPEEILARNESYSPCELSHCKAVCLLGSGCDAEALRLLAGIPEAERLPKVRMLLGNLYRRYGSFTDAMEQYKCVLKENCFAVEAAEGLAQIGAESEICPLIGTNSWLGPWVQSVAHLWRGEFEEAIMVLNASPVFCDIPQGIALKGKAYYYLQDHTMATYLLEKAHKRMPSMMLHMGTLAYLYATSNNPKNKVLDELAETLRKYSPQHPTTLICTALATLISGDSTLAWATIQKVLTAESSNSEANLVAGILSFIKHKYKDAIGSLRLVLSEDPFCFAAHETTVAAFMRRRKWAEARAAAARASSTLGCCAPTLTLKARVVLRGHGLRWPRAVERGPHDAPSLDVRDTALTAAVKKAKDLLDSAVQEDATYVPAVFLLVEVYCLMGKFDDALAVLGTTANRVSMAKLHRVMGDIYLHNKDDEVEALEAYTRALRLDPYDKCANMGLEAIGGPPRHPVCGHPDGDRHQRAALQERRRLNSSNMDLFSVFGMPSLDDDEDMAATSVSSSGSSRPRDSGNSRGTETVYEEDEHPDNEEYTDEEYEYAEEEYADEEENAEQENEFVDADDGTTGPNIEEDEDDI